MLSGFTLIFRRDVALAYRQGGAATLALVFFALTVTLFPLGVGPGAAVLARISTGVLWVTAMLAALLSLDRLFQADWEDGSLDQFALLAIPLPVIVLAKCGAHWVSTGLPLIIAAPFLALSLNMPAAGLPVLLAAMVLGTPALSLIGAIGASLTVAVRRGGALIALLVLPLYIPVLIFGVAAVDAAIGGINVRPHLMILAALSLGAGVLAPIAAGAALRLALE